MVRKETPFLSEAERKTGVVAANDRSLYADLVLLLRNGQVGGNLITARGEGEKAFLERFMEQGGKRNGPSGAATLEDLRGIIERCRRCSRTMEKKFGYGTGENGIMVILYPPSMLPGVDRKEYRQESSELLKKILSAIELDIKECYITSLIKCEIDGIPSTPSAMFVDCEEILTKEIDVVKPDVIIVMGDMVPLKKIMDNHRSISWYCIDHPVSLIKNPELKRKAWNTLKIVRRKIEERDHTQTNG